MVISASRYTLYLVKKYLLENHRRGFTYRGLRKYYFAKLKRGEIIDEVEWHTIERAIRKLAEEGYFERRFLHNGRVVVFLPTELFEDEMGIIVRG